jgi:hypothetical protein
MTLKRITFRKSTIPYTSQRLERDGRKILRGCAGLWVEALNFLVPPQAGLLLFVSRQKGEVFY